MEIIVIANGKGGVGKSITAINLAHNAAEVYGLRTVLVDNDPQADASKFFEARTDGAIGMPDVLAGKAQLAQAVKATAYPLLKLVPTSRAAELINQELLKTAGPETLYIMRDALGQIAADFDLCIIDNPTIMTITATAAIVAATRIIVPVLIDGFSVYNTGEQLEQIENIRAVNPNVKPYVLPTAYQASDETSRSGLEYIKRSVSCPVLEPIRYSPKAREHTFSRVPIRDYSRHSPMATGYKRLAEIAAGWCSN